MNKYTNQLNRILAMFILLSLLPFVAVNDAKAGIFDWFSGTGNEASTSQTFGQLANFLNAGNPTIEEPREQNLPLIQNSSLVALSTPLANKAAIQIKNLPVKRELTVLATAYSSTPDQTDSSPFITAMGTYVRDGIVAANFLPFGTKIKIPEIYGNKIFVVEDRMNRRYWHVIDVWFPDRQSALEFGIKKVKIQILES